ncbi:hypothetical protein AB6A23_20890 [Paenibacillus tarimensis]
MNDDENVFELPQSIDCPNCGRKMRMNYFRWKDPTYVCDSYRQDSDCEMVLMISQYRPTAGRDVSA